MARLDIDGMDEIAGILDQLGNGMRAGIKRIVTAGAEADAKAMEGMARGARHVCRGNMAGNVRGGTYHETMGGGEINVYPQGTDDRGVSNAMKAYVINYGYGGRKTARTGDRFITGAKPTKQAEAAVTAAMQAESEKILAEITGA